jgi:hypothetical protein
MLQRTMIAVLALVLLGAVFFSGSAPDFTYRLLPGYFVDDEKAWSETPLDFGQVTEGRLPESVIEQRAVNNNSAQPADKQILFGDTHVHTTNSADAFMYSLPMMHGASGAYPPAYACDYARFISQLDFYFLTDHAESFTPRQWRDGIDSVRQCNRLAGDPQNPDLVAFVGWEWTQVGATAESHYGHHNVLFKDDNPDLLPARPIASIGVGVATVAARSGSAKQSALLGLLDPRHKNYYTSYNDWVMQMAAIPACDPDTASPDLPLECYETAATPGELFGKLDEWGFDNMVVPHGTSWGFYSPPNSSWAHQLTADNTDPSKTRLIEVYSGHGNSEQFQDFAARVRNEAGEWVCPEPQPNYLPSCWQAGEIIRDRCLAEDNSEEDCNQRAVEARHNFVQVDGIQGFMTVPGSKAEEWLDAGQARDMFLPAFNYRPKKSVQYGLALQNLEDEDNPLRNRWGFIGSTDTHSARAGHGFKQQQRLNTSDSTGVRDSFWESVFSTGVVVSEYASTSLRADQIDPVAAKLFASEFERTTSFLSVGGLAAVHSAGRDRDAIWNAMKRREVYGTSGHRMLLWFDLLRAEGSSPMGSAVTMDTTPRFRAKVLGSFKQLPGCPDYVVAALEKNHLQKMAQGECYNPSEERYEIASIEVIKIRPQAVAGEAIAPLIEDTWKQFNCEPSPEGCIVEFEDPDFVAEGRDALYYVRALEEPIATVNGGNLRTSFDENGQAETTDMCYGDYRTSIDDDCQQPHSQRAWSSPIFVDYKK